MSESMIVIRGIKPPRWSDLHPLTLFVISFAVALSMRLVVTPEAGVNALLDDIRYNRSDEREAIAALKTIATAESIFREGDKDGNGALDYGSLAQLSQAQLIDGILGSGTKHGYIFEAAMSSSTSEFLWFAVARPVKPKPGQRYFETNYQAVIFFTTTGPFALNTTDCLIAAPYEKDE